MPRHPIAGIVFKDGRPLANADVHVYTLDGRPARVYTAPDATEPVTTVPQAKTGSDGTYLVYVDDADYPPGTRFKIEIWYNGTKVFEHADVEAIPFIDWAWVANKPDVMTCDVYDPDEDGVVEQSDRVESIDGARGGTVNGDVNVTGAVNAASVNAGDAKVTGVLRAEQVRLTEGGADTIFDVGFDHGFAPGGALAVYTNGQPRVGVDSGGAFLVGFDFKMARVVDGDYNWKRALVPWPRLLEINFAKDFADGVKINGPKVQIDGDIEFLSASQGVILIDRMTGAKYRIYVQNGQLGVEQV